MNKLLKYIFILLVAASSCTNQRYAIKDDAKLWQPHNGTIKNDAEVKLLDTNRSKNLVCCAVETSEATKPTVRSYKPMMKANISQRVTMPTNNSANLKRELLSKQSSKSSASHRKRHKHSIGILGYISIGILGCALLGWLASLIFAPGAGLTWALIGGLIATGLVLLAFILIILFIILFVPKGYRG